MYTELLLREVLIIQKRFEQEMVWEGLHQLKVSKV